MALVALPAVSVGRPVGRSTHQVSGGQQQRVGVARDLAVEPPILLMDEPFGAVDPIVRTRLQEELLGLQAQVRKTIMSAAHDVEAAALLANPANDFIADVLGEEDGLKLLALRRVSSVTADPGPVIEANASPDAAARAAREHGTDWLNVVDEQ